MGWTYSFGSFHNMKDFASSIIEDVKSYQNQAKTEGKTYWNILANQVLGNTLLIFTERLNNEGNKEKDIFVYLLDKSKNEYGYKNMDAFSGPAQIVKMSKKWKEWFLTDNALLCDDKPSSQRAIKWINRCFQKTLDNKAKLKHKEQLIKQLKENSSITVKLTILDKHEVLLVGVNDNGKTARIKDIDGFYKSCKWNYLELID